MEILPTYGIRQRFRYRLRDITIPGRVRDAVLPIRSAQYSLNGGEPVAFYVEQIADPGIDWATQYKESPAELRCKDLGDFTIEIPVTASELKPAYNNLAISIEDAQGAGTLNLTFDWDPIPLPLPLDLRDLTRFTHVQEIGQVVCGAFDLDPAQNVIRSRAPVYPDAYLALGSPHASQEATYAVRFLDLRGVKWLGPSDFHVGFEAKSPPIGIKTGWSTIGMMALNPKGEARAFISWGDHSLRAEEWVVVTNRPKHYQVEKNVQYRVRQQVEVDADLVATRFKIWRAGESEPNAWLCEENTAAVAAHLPRYDKGSFGLFQHSGMPIEWSDIQVRALQKTP